MEPTAGSRPGARLRLARRSTMALPARYLPTTGSAVGRSPLLRLPRIGERGAWIAALTVLAILVVDAMINPRAFFDLWLMQEIQQVEAPGLPAAVGYVNDLTSSTGAVAMWGLAVLSFALARWWLPAMTMMTLPVGGLVNEAIGRLLVTRTRPHLAELARG